MAKLMSASRRRVHASDPQRTFYDRAQRARVAKTASRRVGTEEHSSNGCLRSPVSQVIDDRIAHLLLALRTDESGFATVANLAFSGARWRLRRRLPRRVRVALEDALAVARGMG